LSEDATHMRNSLVPHLMKWLQENIKERKDIKLFEIEKVFYKNKTEIWEDYKLSGVITSQNEIVYYKIQSIISDFLKTIFVDNFYFDTAKNPPEFSHKWRVSQIIVRGKEIGYVWEIHPTVGKRFDIIERIWFFEIEIAKLLPNIYQKTKAQELSLFQENNFDLSFVVDKWVKWREIANSITTTNKELIKKVELFDIYENQEKLPGKRSLSFTVYIQSWNETLKDEVKSNLIKDIIQQVAKKGWVLR
jgi:phenylalanyl-tRNA synthetase beta chain